MFERRWCRLCKSGGAPAHLGTEVPLLPPQHVIQIPVQPRARLVRRLLLEAIEVDRHELERALPQEPVEILLRPVAEHVRLLEDPPLLAAGRHDPALLVRPACDDILARDAPRQLRAKTRARVGPRSEGSLLRRLAAVAQLD